MNILLYVSIHIVNYRGALRILPHIKYILNIRMCTSENICIYIYMYIHTCIGMLYAYRPIYTHTHIYINMYTLSKVMGTCI